jgi:uncharacterized repeat protein (TIGR04042 family)
MPEIFFDVRWPDGSTESYYSPSLIVEEHFRADSGYPVAEFVRRARTCMRIADSGFGRSTASAAPSWCGR